MQVVAESPVSDRYEGWAGKTGKTGWETNYVVTRYTTPHTIHPPHQIATILEESVIVLRIPSNNIVSLLHGTV